MKDSRLSFTRLAEERKKLMGEKAGTDDLPLDNTLSEDAPLEFREIAPEADSLVCEGCWTEEMADVLYNLSSEYLKEVLLSVRGKKMFSLDKGFEIVKKLVDVNPPNDALFVKAIHYDDSFRYVINHSVNVAIYAVCMAKSLGFPVEKQMEIGMAGLLHEVGMAFIPEDILYKRDQLAEDELKKLQERPKISYEILRNFGDEYAYLAETALHVNERIDGSGYPTGLKGEEIHEYAQIIGLVSIYEALIHSRPQRERFLHFHSVKEIINTSKTKFQRKHFKALLDLFSIFPISSYVKLNSGAIGQVVETYPGYPMRPKVAIVLDSHNQPVLTERIVNLPENPLLHIVDSISQEEVANLR
jgi:HD-GYP domain-containing protein (c-di-GMP phosphodiesterase class II)